MLGSLFTIFGVLLLVIAGVLVSLRVFGQVNTPRSGIITAGVLGVLCVLFQPMTFYAEPGFSYLVQYPTGTQKVIFEPGYHFRYFGNLLPFKNVLSVLCTEDSLADTTSYNPPIEVRFNDAVVADVEVATRFRLPRSPEQFKTIALEFRSQENLVNATLLRSVKEVARNSARMFSAQEYIAGRGGEFETAILDQIRQGVFRLQVEEETIDDEEMITTEEQRTISSDGKRVRLRVSKLVDENGIPIRKENPISVYGIEVTQCTVSKVDPEQKFKDMLSQQRDAAAQANVERQKAKTAAFARQKIVAEGESEKARIRVEEEKKQITTLITAETRKKNEEIILDERRLQKQQAEEEAARIKTLAEAKAQERKLLMEADNALQLRLDTEVRIHQAYADALSKAGKLVPDIVIQNSGEGGTSSAMDLINMLKVQMAQQISNNTKQNN